MSTDPLGRSDEDAVNEVFKPIEDTLVSQEEEVKRLDELIREAERKSKAVLDPEL